MANKDLDVSFPWTVSLRDDGWAEIWDAHKMRVATMSDLDAGQIQAELIVHAMNSLPSLVEWQKDMTKSDRIISYLQSKIDQLESENSNLRGQVELTSRQIH